MSQRNRKTLRLSVASMDCESLEGRQLLSHFGRFGGAGRRGARTAFVGRMQGGRGFAVQAKAQAVPAAATTSATTTTAASTSATTTVAATASADVPAFAINGQGFGDPSTLGGFGGPDGGFGPGGPGFQGGGFGPGGPGFQGGGFEQGGMSLAGPGMGMNMNTSGGGMGMPGGPMSRGGFGGGARQVRGVTGTPGGMDFGGPMGRGGFGTGDATVSDAVTTARQTLETDMKAAFPTAPSAPSSESLATLRADMKANMQGTLADATNKLAADRQAVLASTGLTADQAKAADEAQQALETDELLVRQGKLTGADALAKIKADHGALLIARGATAEQVAKLDADMDALKAALDASKPTV